MHNWINPKSPNNFNQDKDLRSLCSSVAIAIAKFLSGAKIKIAL